MKSISIQLIVLLLASFSFCQEIPAGLKQEGQVAFTEGPVWHAESSSVYFTDIENNRIMRRDSAGKIHVHRTPSGRANGLVLDSKGRLIACETDGKDGGRRITREELDGSITVLTDKFEGGRYNAPNDLTIDKQGRIYFTDPNYGDRSNMEIKDAEGKPIEGVYRIDLDGSVKMVLKHEIDRPNGIGISNDGKYLFVADNNHQPGQARKLWRFDFDADGEIDLSSQKELFDWGNDRGPDGFAIDKQGLLYVTAGFNFPVAEKHAAGVYVIDPIEGGLKKFLPIPADMITNCTFGGKDGQTLFITAGHFLWSLEIQ